MVSAPGQSSAPPSPTQNITVADDADCLARRRGERPFSAFCQAEVVEKHTVESTDGATYAELESDDPLREVAMNSAFLQSSLYTSVVAFGVAGMAILNGGRLRPDRARHEGRRRENREI